jgi:hypothetical protein
MIRIHPTRISIAFVGRLAFAKKQTHLLYIAGDMNIYSELASDTILKRCLLQYNPTHTGTKLEYFSTGVSCIL